MPGKAHCMVQSEDPARAAAEGAKIVAVDKRPNHARRQAKMKGKLK
jgi:hypothetical protein